ncbi:hypothetical protein FB451DRAFT_1190445 [Mycena latifolia]|nr:hypothetical protein FB451DRAFT_1190445 [Mycena latifolia]
MQNGSDKYGGAVGYLSPESSIWHGESRNPTGQARGSRAVPPGHRAKNRLCGRLKTTPPLSADFLSMGSQPSWRDWQAGDGVATKRSASVVKSTGRTHRGTGDGVQAGTNDETENNEPFPRKRDKAAAGQTSGQRARVRMQEMGEKASTDDGMQREAVDSAQFSGELELAEETVGGAQMVARPGWSIRKVVGKGNINNACEHPPRAKVDRDVGRLTCADRTLAVRVHEEVQMGAQRVGTRDAQCADNGRTSARSTDAGRGNNVNAHRTRKRSAETTGVRAHGRGNDGRVFEVAKCQGSAGTLHRAKRASRQDVAYAFTSAPLDAKGTGVRKRAHGRRVYGRTGAETTGARAQKSHARCAGRERASRHDVAYAFTSAPLDAKGTEVRKRAHGRRHDGRTGAEKPRTMRGSGTRLPTRRGLRLHIRATGCKGHRSAKTGARAQSLRAHGRRKAAHDARAGNAPPDTTWPTPSHPRHWMRRAPKCENGRTGAEKPRTMRGSGTRLPTRRGLRLRIRATGCEGHRSAKTGAGSTGARAQRRRALGRRVNGRSGALDKDLRRTFGMKEGRHCPEEVERGKRKLSGQKPTSSAIHKRRAHRPSNGAPTSKVPTPAAEARDTVYEQLDAMLALLEARGACFFHPEGGIHKNLRVDEHSERGTRMLLQHSEMRKQAAMSGSVIGATPITRNGG